MNGHGLTHRSFGDGRLTPACECGWWSSTCERAQFTRHLNAVHDAHLASGTCDCHES